MNAEVEVSSEMVAQLAQEIYTNDVLPLLVLNIWRFEFEVAHKARSPHSQLRLTCCVSACAGQEGCVADLYESAEAANRIAVAHG